MAPALDNRSNAVEVWFALNLDLILDPQVVTLPSL